jgi:uncharacterized protein YgiM (DUF1202 family)
MIDPRTEQRAVKFFAWLTAGYALLIILTSCSPLQAPPVSTGTPAAAATADLQSEVTTPTPPQLCTVSTGYDNGLLNMRTGPGTKYAVLRVLREGDVLTVTTRGAWLQVIDPGGIQGYVYSKYCQVKP